MPFHASYLWLPKDFESPEGYEDAFKTDEVREFAAVADGVSSAIYSRLWAYLLTQAVVAAPPDPDGPTHVDWLNALRCEWEEEVRQIPKNFFQKAKLEQSGGAYATLLWIAPSTSETDAESEIRRFQCYAVGDCCLFQLRAGELVKTFPVTQAADFGLYPDSLASRVKAEEPAYQVCELDVRADDWLFLSTDAWAQWAFTEIEAGRTIDWDGWRNCDDEQFRSRIRHLRDENVIRVDDTTLLMLQFIPSAVSAAPEEAIPDAEGTNSPPSRLEDSPETEPTRETPLGTVPLDQAAASADPESAAAEPS